MRKSLALSAAVAALLVGGCAQAPADPGDKPASSTRPTASASSQEPFEDTSSNEPEPEPSETEDPIANFNQVYTYTDGVEIEVTKLKHGEVSRSDAEYSDPVKAGAAWVTVTFRVRNGSEERLEDAYQITTLTYGPDGEEAETPYLASQPDDKDLDGTILPGKSRSGSETFAVPRKYQDDVQLEIDFESGHETAVFAGSIKG